MPGEILTGATVLLTSRGVGMRVRKSAEAIVAAGLGRRAEQTPRPPLCLNARNQLRPRHALGFCARLHAGEW